MDMVGHYRQCSQRPYTFEFHCVGEIDQVTGYPHQTNLSLIGNHRNEIFGVR
jgi:hypothetical protein